MAGTDGGRRTFRVDRMVTVTVTDDAAQRPAGFALHREWERVVDEMEQRRSLLSATVLVAARLSPILRDRFGRHGEELGIDDDGRARVRVAAPNPLSIAQELAGWGDAVEVVEPDPVKVELARLGTELVARYGQA